MKILSIDIGVHNTALYGEDINIVPDKDHLLQNGTILEWFHVDFRDGSVDTVLKFLGTEPQLLQYDLILIEQQMKTNIAALQIQHVLHTFFRMYEKDVVILSSRLKTSIFDLTCDTHYQRKKAAVEFVSSINDNRARLSPLHIKKDDLADAFLQCKAYLIKTYVSKRKR